VGSSASEIQQSKMRAHFITTSRFEWMFWDMGHTQEQWPV
jgi:thiaminase/transcriptional activator TenA